MADWATISALATASGTLVLAVATFASVRSANAAARTAERMLQAGLRPVLFPSRFQDPAQKITWVDEHITKVEGGRGAVEVGGDIIYMAMSLRNAGAGIAVLDAWYLWTDWQAARGDSPPLERFRRLTRDLYVPVGETGFWQGAIREPDDPDRAELLSALAERRRFAVDLLYSDLEGGQRTVSRFGWSPAGDGGWLCTGARHWHLDRAGPR